MLQEQNGQERGRCPSFNPKGMLLVEDELGGLRGHGLGGPLAPHFDCQMRQPGKLHWS
jgi:hypothetical protein